MYVRRVKVCTYIHTHFVFRGYTYKVEVLTVCLGDMQCRGAHLTSFSNLGSCVRPGGPPISAGSADIPNLWCFLGGFLTTSRRTSLSSTYNKMSKVRSQPLSPTWYIPLYISMVNITMVCIHTYVRTYLKTYVGMHVRIHIRILYVCLYIRIYTQMYCICMYVCTYAIWTVLIRRSLEPNWFSALDGVTLAY